MWYSLPLEGGDDMDLLDEAISIVKVQVLVYVKNRNIPYTIDFEDLEQEALVRMLKHLKRYDPSMGELSTFLCKHTFGAIRDYLRKIDGYSRYNDEQKTIISTTLKSKESRDLFMNLPDQKHSIKNNYKIKETILALAERISKKHRTVLELHYFMDMTMKEIGDIMGFNESRASQIHNEALKRISSFLSAKGINELGQILDM